MLAPEKIDIVRNPEVAETPDTEQPAADMSTSKALFSTRFGQFPPRTDIEPWPNLIVRSAPALDVQKAVEHYQNLYPKQCRDILHDFRLEDWFDPYDIHVRGARFLWNVLYDIASKNQKDMDDFNVQWSFENRSRLPELCGPVTLNQVFSDPERDEYGDVFLNIALMRIRHALYQTSQAQGLIPYSTESDNMSAPTVLAEQVSELQAPMEGVPAAQEPEQQPPKKQEPGQQQPKEQEQEPGQQQPKEQEQEPGQQQPKEQKPEKQEPKEQEPKEQEATCITSAAGPDRKSKFEEARSSSDAEAAANTNRTYTGEKSRRRSSFHGISPLPKGEVTVPQTRNVATVSPTAQPYQPSLPQSSEIIKSPRPYGYQPLPQPPLTDNPTGAPGTVANTFPYGFQRFDNPVYPYSLRPLSQGRRPSSNLRMQVLEGTEVSRDSPSYTSLNEVVHQPPVAFNQAPPAGQQNVPYAYATDGQVIFQPAPSPHGAFQPSQDMPGFYPYHPPSNRPSSRAQPQHMADIPGPAPSHFHSEQFTPARWQEQRSYANDGPQPYSTGSLPPGRQNKGRRQDKRPNEWFGRQASRGPLPAQMSYDPDNRETSPVPYQYGNQDQIFVRPGNPTSQQLHRSRSGSIEPFPPFYGPGLPQALPRGNSREAEEACIDDFICTPWSIGRLRYDIRSLWVTGFPADISTDMLSQIFEQVAQVKIVHIKEKQSVHPMQNFAAKRFAFVDFFDAQETKKALTAFNEGRIESPFRLEIRVPEQNYNPSHIRYVSPETIASEYQHSVRVSQPLLSQPDRGWPGRRSSNSSQRGRDFGYRRLSGPPGQRQSFGRQSLSEEQKVHETHRQYPPPNARGGSIRRPPYTVQNRRSIPEEIIHEGGPSEGSTPHKHQQGSGSTVSHGTSTPRKKQKNRKGSGNVTGSPKQVHGKQTSASSSDTKKSSQDSRYHDGSKRDFNSGVVADAGATVIVEEPSTIGEQSKSDTKISPSNRGSYTTGDVLSARVSEADSDITVRSKEETAVQQNTNKLASRNSSADSTRGSSHSTEVGSTSVDLSKSSSEKTGLSQATLMPETTRLASDAEMTLSAKFEVQHDKAQKNDSKLAVATDIQVGSSGNAAGMPLKDPIQPKIQKLATAMEGSAKSAGDFQGTQEVHEKTGPANETYPSETPAQAPVSQPTSGQTTQKQGPAQTESLSPFSRKKPTKQQPKSEGKKKNKTKHKKKVKEKQPSAPVDVPNTAQHESSGGSRAVSSQSYHTADEPDNDRFEDGKSDDSAAGNSEGTITGSYCGTEVQSPAVAVAEHPDDPTLVDSAKSFEHADDILKTESSAVLVAEQQDYGAPPKFPSVLLAAETNFSTAVDEKPPEEQPAETWVDQKVPTPSREDKGELEALVPDALRAENEDSHQMAQPQITPESKHRHDDSLEPSAVTITAAQPRTSSSTSPNKRRPVPLELSDITNLSPAPAKTQVKEAALTMSSPHARPGSPAPSSAAAGIATTPTGKKRKNNRKKKRSSETSSTKQEDSPASAQYITPSTSYPPLHHAASTTVVGLGSANSSQSVQSPRDAGKSEAPEERKPSETLKPTESDDSQRVAGVHDEQVKDHGRFPDETRTLRDQSSIAKDKPKKQLGTDQKQSLQGPESNVDTVKGTSSTVEPAHVSGRGREIRALPPPTTGGEEEPLIKHEEHEIAKKEETVDKAGVTAKGTKEDGHKSAGSSPWAVSPATPKISFHDIQAGDTARRVKEAKAENIIAREQKGEEPSKHVEEEGRTDAESNVADDLVTKNTSIVEKSEARAGEAEKEETIESGSNQEEEIKLGEGTKMETTKEDHTEKEDNTPAVKSFQEEEAKPQPDQSQKPALWTDLFKG